ncbi:MAG: hypothetical protein ACD_59C00033G0006 [uncultured bacterium]|nr:MAG: hypothetical protein ACD_59C00033G0006 [uncultured bacterium]
MINDEYCLVVEAGKTEKNYWKDLWKYRELFYFLAWRDILVRYKQTIVGIAWSVLRPLLTMLVFTIVFGKLAKLPSNGVPYAIFVYSAMMPWQFFSNALSEGSSSLIGNANLISKVYFPRIIIPASTVIVALVDFLISFILFLLILLWYNYAPALSIIAIPFFLLLSFFTSMGFSLWLCALNVEYRDFRYIVPFIVQFGLYISPVGFGSEIVPEKWRLLYSLNPMVGVIDGFRWSISGNSCPLNPLNFFVSIAVTFIILISGIWYFRKTEKTFADFI